MKLLAAITCSVALLAACGSDSDNDAVDNTTPATATTSTAAPQSTVTIATVAPTSAPTTVSTIPSTTADTSPATVDSTTDTTDDTKDSTDPETTADTTTDTTADTTDDTTPAAASTTVNGGSTTSAPALAAAYTEVTPPVVPAVSAPVLTDNTHPDGVYYATVTEGGDPPPAAGEVVFELVQLFRGADCTAHFGADDADSCVNDYGVETDPTSTLAVRVQNQFISVADAATQLSHRISGTELYSLIHGDEPAAGAPTDYTYVGFGYFLTISGGEVTRLEQWWTP